MRPFPYLLLTVLLAGGPAFMAESAAAGVTGSAALAALSSGDASIMPADSRQGGHQFGSRHGGRNDHFRHPGLSHDRHFGRHDRHFFGTDKRHFRGHDRHFTGRDHRHFRTDDRLFFGHHDRRDPFLRDRHPHLRGYGPGVTVCYRSGSVLVCYGG